MANPQKENGYTPIANELLEVIYSRKFSASQLKIMLLVFRFTYGFNRKTARLSNSFIANGTGLHEVNVSKEVSTLIKDKVLIEQEKPTFNNPRLLGLNKNYKSWQNHLELAKSLRGSKKTLGVSETAKRGGSEMTNQERQYKERQYKKERNALSGELNEAGLPVIDFGLSKSEVQF